MLLVAARLEEVWTCAYMFMCTCLFVMEVSKRFTLTSWLLRITSNTNNNNNNNNNNDNNTKNNNNNNNENDNNDNDIKRKET